MKRAAFVVMLVLGLVLMMSCAHKIEGPSNPTVNKESLTYCGADEQSFVIQGSGLSPMVIDGATDHPGLQMPDVCLTEVADASGMPVSGATEHCIPQQDIEWVSQSEIRFTTRASDGLAPGTYNVVVRNPDGKQAQGTVTLVVKAQGPLVFWADPNVVYNGIATQITIYGSNLGVVASVALRDSTTRAETMLQFKQVGTKENRIQAVVPKGQPVSTYDVVVRSQDGCEADLIRGIKVVDQVNLMLTAIDPSFGWTSAATPVTISGAGFAPVPRAYLNPVMPTASTVASPLDSVGFVNDTRTTGVVPKGLPAGAYDLIVVNPDGKVGLLKAAFTVTTADPPVVTNVSPNYLDNSGAKTVTITGTNFRNPKVTLDCKAPDGTETMLTGSVQPGGTATSFNASLPVGGLPQGTVCVVRVTDDDGSYYDYSAIGISNPASNLNAFIAGPAMATKRRAPAVAAGRATAAARFIYAIGGDNGMPSGAMDTVETTPIDIFGAPGNWYTQPVKLPAPRTLAGVVTVGRFLYLVGGNSGSGAVDAVSRAQVLDPLAAPQIVDVAPRRGKMGEGIGMGIWYYRVSAVMADTDPSNPGGETLPSDPLVVNLSQMLDTTLVLTLIWEPVPGAKAYRVYRNENGTEPEGSEKRIAEVMGGMTTTYEDTRPPGAIMGPPPLPLGATGVWMNMPKLSTPRESAGVATVEDPMTPNVWHIYAIGGQGAAPLASWERLSATIAMDGTQMVAGWTAGTSQISSARSELSAFPVSHANAVQVPAGTAYIYAGGGAGAGSTASNVDVAQVSPGGDLAAWVATKAMSPSRSGYAGLPGAGFLFAFGGQNSMPADGISSAEIDPSAVPQLINWNNEGVRLTTCVTADANACITRYLSGGAVESAFIYIVGGTTTGGPTNSMERTVL